MKNLINKIKQLDTFQVLSAILLIILFWSSFENKPSEIKIGIVLPLTGVNSSRAGTHQKGIMLAVEHVNKSGGINGKELKLLERDDQGDPSKTAIITRNLIYDENILAIIGGFSPESSRVIQHFSEKARIPFLTALCTHYELTENGSSYTFRSITDDMRQFGAICDYSLKRYGARKPALIYDLQLYGADSAQKFVEAALKHGQQIVAAVSYNPETLNFKEQLNIVTSSNPDSLIIMAPPLDSALILRQARESRFLKPILGANSFSAQEFITFAGIYSESTICTLPFNPRLGGQRAEYFMSEFMEKYGYSADSDAAMGYEAAMLTALALKAGEHDKALVKNYFSSMHGWESVIGSGGFDSTGNQVRPAEIAIIKDRQKIPVNLEELF